MESDYSYDDEQCAECSEGEEFCPNDKNKIVDEQEDDDDSSELPSQEADINNEFEHEVLKLKNGGVTELPIDNTTTYEEAPLIEFKNPLMKDIDEKFKNMSPLQLFHYTLDDFIDKMAEYSEDYARLKIKEEVEVTKLDIFKYLFCFMYLSVFKVPEVDMLWKRSELYKTIIPQILSKHRYRKLNQVFHISKYNEDHEHHSMKDSRIEKIKEFIDYLNKKWLELYPYTQNITVDESMAAYKGKVCFRQYIKDKHRAYGVKFFTKASADQGYVYQFLPYTGKNFEFDKQLGMGASIMKTFTDGHENQNYHFTFDNFYTNMYTIKMMNDRKINFTCTFLRNRKTFPEEIRSTALKKGDTKLYSLNNTDVKLFFYYEKKQVQLASNVYDVHMCKYCNKSGQWKFKPEMVCYYNLTKSGVDLVDMAASIYKSQRKCLKWWKAVFFYVLDVTLHNLTILYYATNPERKRGNNSKMLGFREILLDEMAEELVRELKKNKELNIREIHLKVKGTKPNQRCETCKLMNVCDENYKNSTTNFICKRCKTYMCKKCFKDHIQKLIEKA